MTSQDPASARVAGGGISIESLRPLKGDRLFQLLIRSNTRNVDSVKKVGFKKTYYIQTLLVNLPSGLSANVRMPFDI